MVELMSVLVAVSLGGLLVQVVLALLLWLNLRHDEVVQSVRRRVRALAWRDKLRLGTRLMRDRRVPVHVRLIPPALALYLASPLDIVPDFIPVLGQLDDLLVLGIGVGLMVKLTPAGVLSEHLDRLEGLP